METTTGLELIFYLCVFAVLSVIFLGIAKRMLWRAIKSEEETRNLAYQLTTLLSDIDNSDRGFVYIIKSDSGHYKIGKTKDPDMRLHKFEVNLPIEIEPLFTIPTGNMSRLERLLHKT